MKTLTFAIPVLLTIATGYAAAQVAEKRILTLDGAKRVAAAAEADARRRGLPVVIAVVDDAGELLLVERLDSTQVGSIKVGIGKARTAAQFRRPTRFFEEVIGKGRAFFDRAEAQAVADVRADINVSGGEAVAGDIW